jgi:hypothetical protein
MRVEAQQVIIEKIKRRGKPEEEIIRHQRIGFFAQDVHKWVELEIPDVLEIHFTDGTCIMIISSFENFDKIMAQSEMNYFIPGQN